MPTLEPDVIPFAFEPLAGMFGLTPATKIPVGGSPDMLNCYVRGDVLCKRPGYSIIGDAVSASERVMGLYSALDDEDNSFLFAATETGIKRYLAGTNVWSAYTGPALTGGNERKFSWDVSQNSVVFGNGKDQVMRIPFTGTTYAILNANCPAAKYLTRFADRLYLASTVEGGATKPFRVRRSVNSDHTDWTGLGSGFNDLSEYPYHLKGMKKSGAQMLVASEEALWIATRTGISAAPARFDPVVPGVGVYMPHTLTTRGNDHLFYGRDHAYLFSGSRVDEIMNQVRDVVFFAIEASRIHLNHGVIRPETQEWIVFLCEPGVLVPTVAWIWNWHYDICYKWSFSGGIISSAIHRQDTSRTWNALVGSWNAQTWIWTTSQSTANFPTLVTGHDNGKAYYWASAFLSDDGSIIPCRWTSKDFSAAELSPGYPNFSSRWALQQIHLKTLGIEYQESGTDCTLNFYLSNDSGTTWAGPYPVNLSLSSAATGGAHTAALTEGISGDRVRFKFEHSSLTETFCISRFIPEFEILGLPITVSP